MHWHNDAPVIFYRREPEIDTLALDNTYGPDKPNEERRALCKQPKQNEAGNPSATLAPVLKPEEIYS
jgi:hypothetical protein